jgi:DNA polymerase III delta prime subunit
MNLPGSPADASHAALLPALRRLDALLEPMLKAALARGGVAEAALRGLYVSPEEAVRLLHRDPCAPPDATAVQNAAQALATPSRLDILSEWFNLSAFELDIVLIALAPELDLRYERIYGFLQDDASRRRATIDFALNLRTASAEDKIERLAHFMPGAPLIRHGVLSLAPDSGAPLLAQSLKLDSRILAMLLGHAALDARLAPFCRLLAPGATFDWLRLEVATARALVAIARRAGESGQTLRLWFHGRDSHLKAATAHAFAGELGLSLLHVDFGLTTAAGAAFNGLLPVVFREARLRNAALYIDRVDDLRDRESGADYESVLRAVCQHEGFTILAGRRPWIPSECGPDDMIDVPFGVPGFALRRRHWQDTLGEAGLTLGDAELDALSASFRLGSGEISRAVRLARVLADWREAAADRAHGCEAAAILQGRDATPLASDYFAAARAQCGHELQSLARKIQAKQTWSELALPADEIAHLHEICDRARLRSQVFDDWGFERTLSNGKGLIVLFTGSPGTGKTMAAEVIAGEVRQDLYRIDLSRVVSKYIGETEKNLDRIFTAAEGASAILFFDEADALFGKRSEVKDAHDRYANIEIGYLLTKMEEYEGVAILATNLRRNMDDAFLRRVQHIVEFPFPDEALRRRIWEIAFAPQAPLGDDVDFARLASTVKLTGGHIRNIVLAAAFLAASAGGVIRMQHIARAIRREHQKLGMQWDERQLAEARVRPADE